MKDKSKCIHENTIHIGDDEHEVLACTDCKKTLGGNLCPECSTPLTMQQEIRDGGYSEVVYYCNGCGFTRVAR